jgi:hypothetical protein
MHRGLIRFVAISPRCAGVVARDEGYVSFFSIVAYGDLTPVATSNSLGIAAFNGVAISQ